MVTKNGMGKRNVRKFCALIAALLMFPVVPCAKITSEHDVIVQKRKEDCRDGFTLQNVGDGGCI